MTRIGLADLLDSDIDWEAVDFERRSILPTTTKERLRPHQKQALADVSAGLDTHTEDTSAHDLIDAAATDTAVLFKQVGPHGGAPRFTVLFSISQSIETVAAATAGGMADFDLIV